MYPDAGAARLRVGSSSTAPTRKHSAPSDVAALTTVTSTTLPLDGTTRRGHHRYRLPDGEYYAVMTVEKALAERGTPKETWTSPTFRIRR